MTLQRPLIPLALAVHSGHFILSPLIHPPTRFLCLLILLPENVLFSCSTFRLSRMYNNYRSSLSLQSFRTLGQGLWRRVSFQLQQKWLFLFRRHHIWRGRESFAVEYKVIVALACAPLYSVV